MGATVARVSADPRQGSRFDRQGQFTAVAQQFEGQRSTDGSGIHHLQQLLGIEHGLIAHADHQITATQACGFGWPLRQHRLHQGTLALRKFNQGIGVPVVLRAMRGVKASSCRPM